MTRNGKQLILEALVVDDLDVDILAGTPFMATNDIAVRPAKHQITIGDSDIVSYGPTLPASKYHAVRACHVLRAPPVKTTIWPGEYLEIEAPPGLTSDSSLAIEPRVDPSSTRHIKSSHVWPQPNILEVVGGKLRLFNPSDEPLLVRKNDHFCQARLVIANTSPEIKPPLPPPEGNHAGTKHSSYPVKPQLHSESVCVDPGNLLPPTNKANFLSLLKEFDSVFDPVIQGYNGAPGPLEGVMNMGPVEPPQHKGRVPQYARDQLEQLQTKFDELEATGVFQHPEDLQIVAQCLNPSFLVKKRNGGFRLVTTFTDVGRYSKPQPSLMPDVDSTLRRIACWKYIIVSDLSQSFYQIPLSKKSMKYCGVATPFKGVRVYTRCAMGMPGSETALEELMCRVLGDLLQEGCVAKIADDLYCGGNTPQELLANWKQVLTALHRSDLRLSAKKTIICPASTTILGWTWSSGSICTSPHRIAASPPAPLPRLSAAFVPLLVPTRCSVVSSKATPFS